MTYKRLITLTSYCAVMAAGFFIGLEQKSAVTEETSDLKLHNNAVVFQDQSSKEYRVAVNPENEITTQAPTASIDPVIGLRDTDAEVRLSSLFSIWKSRMTVKYQENIKSMLPIETDSRVKDFIAWILIVDKTTDEFSKNESDYISQETPDLQLQESLYAQADEYSQDNEILPQDPMPPEQDISLLTEEEHSEYIEALTKSDEDASIEALGSLISHQDREIQQAAIDGLITVLDDDTGHSQRILELFNSNAAYLDESQMAAIQQAQQLYQSEIP